MRYRNKRAVGSKAENGTGHLEAHSTVEKNGTSQAQFIEDFSLPGSSLERSDCSVLAPAEGIK